MHTQSFTVVILYFQRGGIYGPGPRFILELRPFLSELFKEEIHDCHLCKDPVIRVRNGVVFG